jgi:hypothetical protein
MLNVAYISRASIGPARSMNRKIGGGSRTSVIR